MIYLASELSYSFPNLLTFLRDPVHQIPHQITSHIRETMHSMFQYESLNSSVLALA